MCAQIIEARVKQKKDTLANWEANPMILLDGEQAFVVGSTGQPINFKIGDGTKTFSELPFWIQYDQAAFVPVSGLALPTPTQEVAYTILGEGTYTHASGNVVVPAGHWGVANWDGIAWSFSDMGLMPTADVSSKLDRGGFGGTAQDLQDEINDIQSNFDEYSDINFSSTLNSVRFVSDTTTSSVDTTQSILDDKTIRVSRVSAGATASCVYLDTGKSISSDNKLVSFRYKINSEIIANSGVMLGYGSINNIPSVVPRGICWRSSGQLFFITPYSSTGTFPTQQTYTVGDIVGIDYEAIFDQSNTNIVAGRFRLVKNGVYSSWFDDSSTYFGTIMIGFRGGISYDASGTLQNSNNILNQAKEYTDVQIMKKASDATFYVDSNVSSSGIGTFNSPFKTFSDAIGAVGEIPSASIIAKGGIYRESINLVDKNALSLRISNYNNEGVKIFGSNQVTGWSKTADRTNIYQTSFSGTIPSQVRGDRRIFEYGRPSFPITANERHALQRGLSHMLPYTEISEVTGFGTLSDSLNYLDLNQNKFVLSGGILYVHIESGQNPSTTGNTIENQTRSIIIPPFDKRNVNIKLDFIGSYFSSNYGWDFINFTNVYRNNCHSYGSRNNGFADDIGNTYAFMDISGGSGNDGASGHFNRRLPNYTSLDQLSGMNSNTYIDPWYFRNRDDGISHHVYGDATCIGGLFEYNGKAGVIPANGANWRQYGGLARNNAVAGFYVGNAISERSFSSARVENFVSQGNAANYRVGDDANWTLNLINCHSIGATAVGYRCSMGVINATNCTTMGDSIVKLPENGGTINVINPTKLT